MLIKESHLEKRGDAVEVDTDTVSSLYDYNSQTSVTSFVANYNNIWATDRRNFVGWDTPRYHARVKAGELIPFTPWKRYALEGSGTGSIDYQYTTGGVLHRRYTTGNHCNISNLIAQMSEEEIVAYAPSDHVKYAQWAASRLYSNSGFDALTFIAELASVRRMFQNLITKILKLKLPKNWKQVADQWLEWRYGWRTLMFDLRDLSSAIQSLNSTQERLSDKYHTRTIYTNVGQSEAVYAYYSRLQEKKDTIEVSTRGAVVADIQVSPFQFNPAVTAWELVPFSFVVDWLLDVGKALNAASFVTLNSEYTACSGYRIQWTREVSNWIGDTYTGFVSGTDVRSITMKAEYEYRVPCSIPLTPQLTFRVDSFKILDLLSLFLQRFRR